MDKCVCVFVQPVSRVVEHLKQCHRRYLDIPAVYLTPPLNSRYVHACVCLALAVNGTIFPVQHGQHLDQVGIS